MMTDRKDGEVPPLVMRVSDPVLWLEHHDRDVELHQTVAVLLHAMRVTEAVMCLETYIGRSAVIRAQVDGWDYGSGWPPAVANLARNRSLRDCRVVLRLLKNTKSSARERKLP